MLYSPTYTFTLNNDQYSSLLNQVQTRFLSPSPRPTFTHPTEPPTKNHNQGTPPQHPIFNHLHKPTYLPQRIPRSYQFTTAAAHTRPMDKPRRPRKSEIEQTKISNGNQRRRLLPYHPRVVHPSLLQSPSLTNNLILPPPSSVCLSAGPTSYFVKGNCPTDARNIWRISFPSCLTHYSSITSRQPHFNTSPWIPERCSVQTQCTHIYTQNNAAAQLAGSLLCSTTRAPHRLTAVPCGHRLCHPCFLNQFPRKRVNLFWCPFVSARILN